MEDPWEVTQDGGVEMSLPCNELFSALAKFQSRNVIAEKRKKNPHFKSDYADLEAVMEAAAEAAKEGLCVIQMTETNNGEVTVVTTLGHSSGQWMRGRLTIPPLKRDPQAYGSLLTYMRRYGISSALGISAGMPPDDDANAASVTVNADAVDWDKAIEDAADDAALRRIYSQARKALDKKAFEAVAKKIEDKRGAA